MQSIVDRGLIEDSKGRGDLVPIKQGLFLKEPVDSLIERQDAALTDTFQPSDHGPPPTRSFRTPTGRRDPISELSRCQLFFSQKLDIQILEVLGYDKAKLPTM